MFKELEQELRVVELDGMWWRPEMPAEKRYGHFRHSIDASYGLQLIDNYEYKPLELNGGINHVLRGVCLPDKNVTLLRAKSLQGFLNSTPFLEMSDVKVYSPFALIGDIGFENEEEIAFSRLSFGITNLLPWCGWSMGMMAEDRNGGDRISPIALYSDEFVKIDIKPHFHYKCAGNSQQYDYDGRLEIRSANGVLPYFGKHKGRMRFYERKVLVLLVILIGVDAVAYDFIGETPMKGGRVAAKVRLMVRRQMPEPKVVEDVILTDLMMAPYRDIKSSISEVVSKIIALDDELFSRLERFVFLSTCCRSEAYELLPQWIFFFEGVASNIYNRESLSVEEKEFVKKYNDGKPPSDLQRLFVFARRSVRKVLKVFDNDYVYWSFIERMRNGRNEFAHGKNKSYLSTEERIAGLYLMVEIVRLIILDYLGALTKNTGMALNNKNNIIFALKVFSSACGCNAKMSNEVSIE